MSTLVDIIEMMIKEMLDQNDGEAKINRADLAEQVSCVPSQVTYVVKTRFSPGNGYMVESRRGGGGQIIIKKVPIMTKHEYLKQMIDSVGNGITQQQAKILLTNSVRAGVMSEREGTAIMSAVSDNALSKIDSDLRAIVRADILKNAIMGLMLN